MCENRNGIVAGIKSRQLKKMSAVMLDIALQVSV